jgi:hypothetical protein
MKTLAVAVLCLIPGPGDAQRPYSSIPGTKLAQIRCPEEPCVIREACFDGRGRYICRCTCCAYKLKLC